MNKIDSESFVKRPVHLPLLFQHIHKNFGKFIVLRGYSDLPDGYINDIDIYIHKKNFNEFRSTILSYKNCAITFQIKISRLGLIKCEINLAGHTIQLDIIYGFYYAGLSYQDDRLLFSEASLHQSSLFYIPRKSHEINISLLKEILHNGRIRADKAEYLLKSIEKSKKDLISCYLSKNDLDSIKSAILLERYNVSFLSICIRLKLLLFNLTTYPLRTIKNILLFFWIKYRLKNTYHLNLIENNE